MIAFPADAHVAVAVIEGRGIWLELVGPLTDGCCGSVAGRLDRLRELGFGVVVIDAGRLRAIDGVGTALLAAFVNGVAANRGKVVFIDPAGRLDGDALCEASIRCAPPDGTWWTAPPR